MVYSIPGGAIRWIFPGAITAIKKCVTQEEKCSLACETAHVGSEWYRCTNKGGNLLHVCDFHGEIHKNLIF